MKLLIGDQGNVDFDEPIKMTIKQKKEFITFLKTIFEPSVVKEKEVTKFRSNRLGEQFFTKEWTDEEYCVLYYLNSTDKLCSKLGRTWMSINIQRGYFLGDFLRWLKKHKKDIISGDVKELIKEYLKSKEAIKLKRKGNRQKLQKSEKELKDLEYRYYSFIQTEKKSRLEFLKRLGQISAEEVKKEEKQDQQDFKNKRKELLNEINDLKKELGEK